MNEVIEMRGPAAAARKRTGPFFLGVSEPVRAAGRLAEPPSP
jgi:hypothetical protein